VIYLKYLKYVVRHKWFVFLGCLKLGKDSSFFFPLFWLGIVHDWSKFRPSEFLPYAKWFNGPYGIGWSQEKHGGCGDEIALHEELSYRFDVAWLKHQHRNKHHWQHWLLQEDNGPIKTLDMPDTYLFEMIADWYGAGRAITGRETISPWYEANKEKIRVSERTRKTLETIIENFERR
jgi:hypothetical protein